MPRPSSPEPAVQSNYFTLGDPVPIADHGAHEPDIAMGPTNEAWIVWSQRTSSGDRILMRTSAAGKLGSVREVGSRAGVEFQPSVVRSRNGDMAIVWVAFRDGAWRLIQRENRQGDWGSESEILTSPQGLFRPAQVVDDSGARWIACERVGQDNSAIALLRADEGRTPEEVQLSAGAATRCQRPALAQGPEGGVYLAFDGYRDGRHDIYVQRVDLPGAAEAVVSDGYQNLQPALASGPDGRLWLAFSSNRNDHTRDPWALPKWMRLRCFDGDSWSEPAREPRGMDLSKDDSYQGWEFPSLTVDSDNRVWVFGQASHCHYAQSLSGSEWSPLHTISAHKWGTWKPRFRSVPSNGEILLVSMGLAGAQFQRLEISTAGTAAVTAPLVSPPDPHAAPARIELSERPSIVGEDGERLHAYWGDLHAHTAYGDATGDVDEIYRRYRDGYGYDFAALTEHDYLEGMELSRSELKMIWSRADQVSVDEGFIALHAYEWSAPPIAEHAGEGQHIGEGHKHVLYPNDNGPLVSYGDPETNTGGKMLARLKGERALVVPHHSGWSGIDWEAHDENLQRLVEVVSAHGRFEFAGNTPIGHRRDQVMPDKFVLEALRHGHRLGFVGGSDSHGLIWHGSEPEDRVSNVPAGTRVGWKEDAYRSGMTVVFAPRLTREELFSALEQRRCYATTGVPILVDFRINGQLMGSDIHTQETPHLHATVRGTSAVRTVEVVRSGHVWARLALEGGPHELSFAHDDEMITPGESHYYYLRVLQEDGNMAWSSPIWVTYSAR